MAFRTRISVVALALAGLWVFVYWAQPSGSSTPEVALEIAGRPNDAIPVDPLETEILLPSPDPLILDDDREQEASEAGESESDDEAAQPEEDDQEASQGVEPPRFVEYTVQAGDTLSGMAQSQLGSVRYAAAILRANDIEPHRLRPGRVILIPVDPENVQGKPSDEEGEDAEIPEDLQVTYIIREGDTLSQIASRFYGSSAKWRLIRDANADINENGTNIRPGMELVIPPMPAE